MERFEDEPQRAPQPKTATAPTPPPEPALGGRRLGEMEQQFRSRQLMEQRLRLGGRMLEQPAQPNFAQRVAGLFSGIRGPGYDFFPGVREALAEAYKPIGFQEISSALRGALGIGGEAVAPAPLIDMPSIKTQRAFGARRYSAALRSLYQGVRPPFLGFGIQEFMGLTDEEMEDDLGYVKVPGGWAMRPVVDQPLENVYGSGTAARPQTVNVNYGGYGGGGGGGTRQQSSYLVNWRI